MRRGFEALREVIVAGYRPSVARLYDPPDGAFHFSRFAAKDDCVLLFMAEGPAGVVKATVEGIREIVGRFPECRPVDPHHLAAWFADLNWGPDKIANERREILATRAIGRTTEVSADWSTICDLYESALRRLRAEMPDITMAGGHSSHAYINGTNMYFVYYYDVKCPPEEEVARYRTGINRIICEETLRLGGSVVHHHGMGKARTPWVRDEYGSSYYILERLKRAFDPNDVMNKGCIIP
jgi:alkyldihydroxyacetonephosphate synthase